jgi:hypothetical protein
MSRGAFCFLWPLENADDSAGSREALMADMSWEYVAGFFDGEGHVGLTRQKRCGEGQYSRGSIRATMVQSLERGRVLLEEIRRFLAKQGICSAVGIHAGGGVNTRRCYHVRITGFRSVVPFLRGIFPFLRIKKLEAQDFIRYDKAFPSLVGKGHSHTDNVKKSWESRRRLYGGNGYRNPLTPSEHGRLGCRVRWAKHGQA